MCRLPEWHDFKDLMLFLILNHMPYAHVPCYSGKSGFNAWLSYIAHPTNNYLWGLWSYLCPLSLSLSGACQEDVAASTSVRHAGLSQARRLADARPKLCPGLAKNWSISPDNANYTYNSPPHRVQAKWLLNVRNKKSNMRNWALS